VLLSTLIVVTTSVGAGATERVGVRTLIEEAPTRLRLAAAVIASAVRDLGIVSADDHRTERVALAIAPVRPRAIASDGIAYSIAHGSSKPTLRAPLPDALRAIPPPMA